MMTALGDLIYLSRHDVERLEIPIQTVICAVEKAFLEKAMGRAEAPPKPGIHPQQDAFIHAMPAYLSKMRAAGVKWVSGFQANPAHGLPYISGLLILSNVENGFPMCVMDCTWITAKRTGAATAVAARRLARKDSKTLGMLGCGAQGRSNVEALKTVCSNLEKVKAYDINERNLRKYAEDMTAEHGLEIITVNSPREAVEDCDIVVTAGPILKDPHPVIESSWFKTGAFACALDFDSYWKPEAMRSVDKFCTDDREQLKYYETQGYFSDIPEVYADLAEIVSGRELGRQNDWERILTVNLGLAIEDICTAILVYERAVKAGIGKRLPL
jgi:ornithine cyclodeaminase/alanine dehydrogenase-like protein (mu-crystallin family)